MSVKHLIATLIAVGFSIFLVQANAQGLSIDAAADRMDEPKKDKTASAEPKRRSNEMRIEAIYGAGPDLQHVDLRTDLIVNGELLTNRGIGSPLPHGLQVAKILPLEVQLTDGKKTIRLFYTVAPQITEGSDALRNGGSRSPGRDFYVPPPTPSQM